MEEYWENNENVAIIDFLDDLNQPYSCFQWGIFGDANLPTIIDDSDYNFRDHFLDVYPTNVFIDHEMRVYAILDTMSIADQVNTQIQEMLNNMELEVENNYNSHISYNYKITNFYPNPFNPVLIINFDIPFAGVTQIDILDISGAQIETLYSGFLQSGSHELKWNAKSKPSGVYLVSLKSSDQNLTEKVVLLK